MSKSIPLKEIVGFLPYELKGISNDGTIYFLGIFNNMLGSGIETKCLQTWQSMKIKPAVRQLSDLTKEITHNGETFVPIVELFKIAIDVNDPNFKVRELKIEDDFYCIVALDNKNQEIVFGFDNKDKSFGIFYENKTYSVFNQLELFDKMYEYLIDFRDWIKDGLAVDINTI